MKASRLLFLIFISLILYDFSYGQEITPMKLDGKYYFQVANVYFEVDPSFGSRISSFKIDNQEILYPSQSVGDYLWGSTFWQSPQSVWNWPPSTALDQNPYSGGIIGNKIILRSNIDLTYSHLIFKKTFTADLSDTSISIVYTMINKDTQANSFSGWEVSRVPSGGLSFFPKGSGSIEGDFASKAVTIKNIVWYEQSNTDPGNKKFKCDGLEGWSAHVNEDNILFIKKFIDSPYSKRATESENEIELYHSGVSGYIELENQSEYKRIPVGDSVSWNMKFTCRHSGCKR
jgi:hypothetical protein